MKKLIYLTISIFLGFLLAQGSREVGLFFTIYIWGGLIPAVLLVNVMWYVFLKYIMKINMRTFKYSSKWSNFNTYITTIYSAGFCTMLYTDPHITKNPHPLLYLQFFLIPLILINLFKKNYRFSLVLLLMTILYVGVVAESSIF